MGIPWKTLLYYTGMAYVQDVVVRPSVVALEAIKEARSRGKPVLNIGAGTPGSSLRVALLGPTLWGDVNMDIAAKKCSCRPDNVCFGDAHNIPFPDKYFGACIASHVVEHLDDPQSALQEMGRVADKVYAITPKWWAPHTWMHPGHQWYVSKDGQFYRLWEKGKGP
jgi:ubiquinone/menaquinone biosynthesis C-methylase UbiE